VVCSRGVDGMGSDGCGVGVRREGGEDSHRRWRILLIRPMFLVHSLSEMWGNESFISLVGLSEV